MVSDLTKPTISFLPAGVTCRTPHALGNRVVSKAVPTTPDWSAFRTLFDKYAKLAVKK